MAAYLTVSLNQWKQAGFSESGYIKMKSTGNVKVVWGPGNHWMFRVGEGEPQGSAHYSGKTGIGVVDDLFKQLYKKHTGEEFAINAPAAAMAVAANVAAKSTSKLPKLKDATQVGVFAAATSKPYVVYAITPFGNLSCRKNSSALSMRAEKLSPTARAALKSWGFSESTAPDGVPYCSAHVTVDSPATAKKTLGSVLMTMLAGNSIGPDSGVQIADPNAVLEMVS